MAEASRKYRRLAGQVLVAGFHGQEPPDTLLRACRAGELGGVILFARNLTGDVADVAALVERLTVAAPDPLLVSIDQEGGRVQRLRAPVLQLPPMRVLGNIDDESLTRRAARALGEQLALLGITTDFAPVLDVDTNPLNPIIGDRSFSRDAAAVARHGLAFAAGLSDSGVAACGKHFPGHGDTEKDSHLDLPRIAHARDRLDAVELAPFRAARGKLPMIMTAHVVFDAIDPGVPATLSKKVITELLRGELAYDGVIVSDDLEMKAVADHFGVAESACAAIEAGCDVLLVCHSQERLDACREALALKASDDPVFARRLEEAADRHLALRRAHRPAPETERETLLERLAAVGAASIESEIASRHG